MTLGGPSSLEESRCRYCQSIPSLRASRGTQPSEHGFVESSDRSFAWLAQAVRSIAAGGQHTVAVTDMSVHTWGSNSCGQLGTRTFRDKGSPTEVKDLTGKGVCQVACGLEHTLFLCGYVADP